MKISFILSNSHFFRFFAGVAQSLCERGHTVHVLHGGHRSAAGDRSLVEFAESCTGFTYEEGLHARQGRIGVWLWRLRALLTYAMYMRADHPSRFLADRYLRFLPRRSRRPLGHAAVRWLLSRPGVQQLLRFVDRTLPADRLLLTAVRRLESDVIVVSPCVYDPRARETEYLKAAVRAGIPTALAVASWDNLTSKCAISVLPDMVLVWNDALAAEAVALHGVPSGKIAISGALPFDFWFELAPTLDRAAFCRRVGLDPAVPFAVYLCSSKAVGPAETGIVQELVRELRQSQSVAQLNVLVRPHPFNGAVWSDFDAPGVAVWPPGGELPDVSSSQLDYYHSLHFSAAVVGLNTSGFIEAAIVDRPCVAVMSREYERMQRGIGHFHHLLDAGFLEIVEGAPRAIERLAEVVSGHDRKADARRRFVERFVRPAGVTRPAREVAAQRIIDLAGRRSMQPAPTPQATRRIAGPAQGVASQV